MARGQNIAPAPRPVDRQVFDQAMRHLPGRLAAKIRFEPATSCWLWQGSTNDRGSGQWWDGQRTVRAHRAVYEALFFKIAPTFDFAALCRCRSCVNPDHRKTMQRSETLRLGLSGENIAAPLRARTACPKGHLYDDANTAVRNGRRHCRACARQRHHARRIAEAA